MVYPRVCGGTPGGSCRHGKAWGLSPRVRGNLFADTQSEPAAGSIPACAGEPMITCMTREPIMVYPRVCGGTRTSSCTRLNLSGLSPRVRGNRTDPRLGYTSTGSIPACAGEPLIPIIAWTAGWVYPRVCGGTAATQRAGPKSSGLSPRVRGNLHQEQDVQASPGSIPACAGEPPRVRGNPPTAQALPG